VEYRLGPFTGFGSVPRLRGQRQKIASVPEEEFEAGGMCRIMFSHDLTRDDNI